MSAVLSKTNEKYRRTHLSMQKKLVKFSAVYLTFYAYTKTNFVFRQI